MPQQCNSFFVFLSKKFHCWHQYQSLTVDVSSAVGALWRCGVLTTSDGMAGIGLGHEWGWRLLACSNGASPDCIVVVGIGCASWLDRTG